MNATKVTLRVKIFFLKKGQVMTPTRPQHISSLLPKTACPAANSLHSLNKTLVAKVKLCNDGKL